MVAAVEVDEDSLMTRQKKDPELAPISNYLENGKLARSITMTSSQYNVQEGILYQVEPDSTSLQVIPPTDSRERLLREPHGGAFGAHLGDTKVHSELRKQA